MSFAMCGSRTPSGCHLRARARSDAVRCAERGRPASTGDGEGLTDDLRAFQLLLKKSAIGIENQFGRFFQIRAGFLQSRTLRVGTRKLLHESDEAFGNPPKHSRELNIHGNENFTAAPNS